MIDPIKKFNELQTLTEGMFNHLFSKVKTPPAAQQSDALRAYNQKYQIRYWVVGHPNKIQWNAADLIKGYKNGEINNDTELIQVGVKRAKPMAFKEFMKYEPYKSELSAHNEEKENTDPNPSYDFATIETNPFTGEKSYKKETLTIPEIAKYINENPTFKELLKVYDPLKKSFIPIMTSSLWGEISNWMNNRTITGFRI